MRVRASSARRAWVLVAIGIVVACAKPGTEQTYIQGPDVDASNDADFVQEAILDDESFEDWEAFDVTQIEKFLSSTAYGRPSFLNTYQSNGVRAADAISYAAYRYKINPIVFLVRAQADQGLISEQYYPSPAYRAEFAFGCGCRSKGSCDPAYAGFDLQIECLGKALRKSLDELRVDEFTAGGWTTKEPRLTVDNVSVQPSTLATAALYQYTPKVGRNTAGGTWLFWKIWQHYSEKMNYFGPEKSSGGSSAIGQACDANGECGQDEICVREKFTDGMCTKECTGTCPEGSSCIRFTEGTGYCLVVCNPSAPACRAQYFCKENLSHYGDNTSVAACYPE